jgi:hypothetical protein
VNLRRTLFGLLLSTGAIAGCDDGAATPPFDAGSLDAGAVDAGAGDAPEVGADVPVAVDAGPIAPVADRRAGERLALALGCDPTDPTRCLMPWPSSSYMQADESQVTRLRLRIPPAGLVSGDRVAGLERADGFSRASPLVVAFPAALDPATVGDGATGAVRLIVAEGPTRGTVLPVRPVVIDPQDLRDPETGIVAYPRTLLAPATEHVAVVLDSLRATGGATLQANDETRAALGLQAPRTPAQERLRAWHAPTRALLAQAGIDPARVLRVWGFVTRSREQPLVALRAMRARSIEALRDGSATVQVDSVSVPSTASAALVVNGRIRGLPRWVDGERLLTRQATGPVPLAGMTYDAPFRVLLPAGGSGPYPAVVFGHGMGGEVTDGSFDDLLASAGAAKINIRFDGLTETEMANTFLGFLKMNLGVEQASSVLLQALAGGMAVIHSMRGATPEGVALPAASNLRDILAAPMVGARPNPLAGRRANPDTLTWAGGSLGGTTGITMVNAEPAFVAGVANVPGVAWSHFLIRSVLFDIVRTGLQRVYGSTMDIQLQAAISQTLWDEVDGAAWADAQDNPRPLLIQEAMGDPVLPNLGTEFAASALGAVQVGAVLTPIAGVSTAASAEGRTAITQYRVPASVTSAADIHGFAARSGVASEAALEQIRVFLAGAWMGQTRVVLPQNCVNNTPAGSCDFSASR